MVQEIPHKVHFIGIGGAGMSGIAHILAELGYEVSGSDLKISEALEKLRKLGAKCYVGHEEKNVIGAEMVVISTAIPSTNPELMMARKLNLTIVHRGEMLAKLMNRQKGIAVAGSHGKTTTTSMMALVLEKAGINPTIVIGGELNDIGGNAKLGSGDYLVAEADESDGSFLRLRPSRVIVTNIEDDHLDYYGTAEKIVSSFLQFINSIYTDGLAVLCADDDNIQKILSQVKVPYVTYGLKNKADYTIKNIDVSSKVNIGEVYYKDAFIGKIQLAVPGKHNLSNALAVLAMGLNVGLDFATIAKALTSFHGAHRRYELLGEIDGIRVVDDYAHHPTEIKATLQAARQTEPNRVISVFQPHRYSRTQNLYEQFGAAFSSADLVIINKIYSAGEKPIEGVTAQLIVEALKRHQVKKVVYIDELSEVADYLAEITLPGDLVLTMGAGNVWSSGVALVKKLQERCYARSGFAG